MRAFAAAAMTSPKCSSVCRGGLALLFAVAALFPRSADAAPILLSGGATDPATGVFVINPVPSTQVTGAFEFDNDVALFQFVLGAGSFTFTAATTTALNSFDPILMLFAENGAPVTYTADGGEFPALFFGDIDADVQVPPLTLAGEATYTLALSQFGPAFGNFPRNTLQEGYELAASEFRCFTMGIVDIDLAPELCHAGAEGLFGGQSGDFALTISATPIDTPPIPEPGTLSLMAAGSAGAAWLRRRRMRRTGH